MRPLREYSRRQFSIFRAALGCYLVICFAWEFPYRFVFYGNGGVMPLNYLPSLLPAAMVSFYANIWSDGVLNALCFLRIGLAFAIAVGFRRRRAAVLLYLANFLILNRNPIATSPEVSFVNWLILALALIPGGAGLSLEKSDQRWFMPMGVYYGGWVVLTVSYFYSAVGKIQNGRWLTGDALTYFLLEPDAARHWVTVLASTLPAWAIVIASYFVLAIEFAGPAMIFSSKSRLVWWSMSTLMHLCILALFSLGQVTVGMLLFHFFLLDVRWIRAEPNTSYR